MARVPAPRSASRTDIGRKRQNNEDAHFRDDVLGLYVVADGVGGNAAGEVAAVEAIDQVVNMVRRSTAVIDASEEQPIAARRQAVHQLLKGAVQAATYMVFGLAEEQPEHRGMGTTISALLITHKFAFAAQVGDSRVYRLRGRELVQVTEDHTPANARARAGLSAPQGAHPVARGQITRAVGTRDWVEVDTYELEIKPKDRFLLCTDGVHDCVDARDLRAVLGVQDLQQASSDLVDLAREGGGRDNITAVVVEC